MLMMTCHVLVRLTPECYSRGQERQEVPAETDGVLFLDGCAELLALAPRGEDECPPEVLQRLVRQLGALREDAPGLTLLDDLEVVLELATDGEQRLAAVQRQELRVPADHAGHMPARPRTTVRRGEDDASFRCARPVPVPRALLRAATSAAAAVGVDRSVQVS